MMAGVVTTQPMGTNLRRLSVTEWEVRTIAAGQYTSNHNSNPIVEMQRPAETLEDSTVIGLITATDSQPNQKGYER